MSLTTKRRRSSLRTLSRRDCSATTRPPPVWGRIVVHEGSLRYVIEEPDMEEHLLVPGTPGIVEPRIAHHVVIDGPVRFCLEFYR